MENVAYLVIVILAIVNFIIYHKLFRVFYFDLGRGLLKEILGCFIVALIEYGILVLVGEFVFKVLIVITILFGAFLIYKKVKGEKIDSKIKRLFAVCLCCLGVVCIPYIANSAFEDGGSHTDKVENDDYSDENNKTSDATSQSVSSTGGVKEYYIEDINSNIDLYNFRYASEEDIMRELGFKKNDNGLYPNDDDKVIGCADGQVYAIYINDSTDKKYNFLNISLGEHITSVKDKVQDKYTFCGAGTAGTSEEILQAFYMDNTQGSLQIFFDKETYLIDSMLYVTEARILDAPTDNIYIEGLSPEEDEETVENNVFEFISDEYETKIVVEYIGEDEGFITFYRNINEDGSEEEYTFTFKESYGFGTMYNIKGEEIKYWFRNNKDGAIFIQDSAHSYAFVAITSTSETTEEVIEEEQVCIYEYNNFNTTNEYDVTVIVEYINDEDGFITLFKADRYNENANEEKYVFSFKANGAEIYDVKGERVECYFVRYGTAVIEITDMITWNTYFYDEATETEVTEQMMPTSYKFASWDEEVEYVVYLYFNSDFTGGDLRIDKTTYRGEGASSMCEYFEYLFVADEETEGIYRIHDEYTGYQNMYFDIASEECFILNIYDEQNGTVESYLEAEWAYNNVG